MLNITRCRRASIHESGTSPGADRSRLRTLAAIGLAAALASAAAAQTAPTWNRAVGPVSVNTDPPVFDFIRPRFQIEVPSALTFMNLDTVVKTYINGSAVNSQTIDITVSPGSAGGCGISCATFQPCICVDTPWGDNECFCSGGWITCQAFPASLEPGDEITVILYPAPGALPETDDDDDANAVEFVGQSLNWDRAIESTTVVPNRADPDLFDIYVDVAMFTQYQGDLDLGVGLELTAPFVVPTAYPAGDFPISSGLCQGLIECETSCAWDGGGWGTGTAIGFCNIYSTTTCNCTWTSAGLYVIEGAQLLPGFVYDLQLDHGSGAFTPYLPDSTDEAGSDSLTVIGPCEGDLDYNGIINGVDLALLLGAWGTDDDAADLDGNNIVNGLDLALLLAAWGQCEYTGPAV